MEMNLKFQVRWKVTHIVQIYFTWVLGIDYQSVD